MGVPFTNHGHDLEFSRFHGRESILQRLLKRQSFHVSRLKISANHASRQTPVHVFTCIFSYNHVLRLSKNLDHASRLDPIETHNIMHVLQGTVHLSTFLHGVECDLLEAVTECKTVVELLCVERNDDNIWNELYQTALDIAQPFEMVESVPMWETDNESLSTS